MWEWTKSKNKSHRRKSSYAGLHITFVLTPRPDAQLSSVRGLCCKCIVWGVRHMARHRAHVTVAHLGGTRTNFSRANMPSIEVIYHPLRARSPFHV